MRDIRKDDIILFVKGNNERPIGYTLSGKVILCKNDIALGYAKVKLVEERKKVILVEAENVLYDYYNGMNYNDFLKLLQIFNFKIGYDLPFIYHSYEGRDENGNKIYVDKNEHQIFAYNLDYNVVIVAETWNNSNTFNSIEIYCPNINGHKIGDIMLRSGTSKMALFDITFYVYHIPPLHYIMKKMQMVSKEWPKNESICLWHYADERDENNLWDKTIDRIFLAPAEVDEIFKNCERMKPILAKRK